jgi:hypothetical protein
VVDCPARARGRPRRRRARPPARQRLPGGGGVAAWSTTRPPTAAARRAITTRRPAQTARPPVRQPLRRLADCTSSQTEANAPTSGSSATAASLRKPTGGPKARPAPTPTPPHDHDHHH